MPPSASPLRHSTPARKATSASPVQSITVRARIASRPALLSMTTPFTSLPSLMTSVQKTYISTSTPASSINCCARVLLSSGIDDRQAYVELAGSVSARGAPAPAAGR